jgi:hypothetical protein
LSNRSPVDAMIFNLSGRFGKEAHIIRRNSNVGIRIDNISAETCFRDYVIEIVLCDPAAFCDASTDILSIDRLSIRRDG